MAQKRTNENDLVVSGNAAAARRKAARPRSKYSAAAAAPEVSAPAAPETTEAAPALSVAAALTPATVAEPARDQVARLAYSYWVARGCQGGTPEEDWLRAETEIRTMTNPAV